MFSSPAYRLVVALEVVDLFGGNAVLRATGHTKYTIAGCHSRRRSRRSASRDQAAGGTVTVDPFDFPGGRRFHFREPGGSELAVWRPTE